MNPGMRIRSVQLRAVTKSGEANRTLEFADGLNLLRADNSSGKSTALQAIIYALGLEGMLSPSHRIPLPHAMTDSIEIRGSVERITESFVTIEIANSQGVHISATRWVVHPTKDKNLINVVYDLDHRPRQRDYFVRLRGGAQSESGFHKYLADFLDLQLPKVTRTDGSEGPLYLETLFPYFFVEQKHGWSGIQARIPTYLGIRDVGKRSAEYILGLQTLERTIQRQRIRSNMSELEVDWHTSVAQLLEAAKLNRVVVNNLPKKISQEPGGSRTILALVVEGEWRTIDETIQIFRDELAGLREKPVSTVASSSTQVEARLQHIEYLLRQALGVSTSVSEERLQLERHSAQVSKRLEALSEDLQRHKDARVLQRLGSEHAHELLVDNVCPTCHQGLQDGADVTPMAMTVAESIKFIEQQISMFSDVQSDNARVIDALKAREQGLASDINVYRREIRSSRETLISSNSSLSLAEISRRLNLENRIEELENLRSAMDDVINGIADLRGRWVSQNSLLKSLEKDDLSDSDRQRIERLQRSMRQQLDRYGFRSLGSGDVDIDPSSYRPVHEGFDLGFDLSASDMIRLIWAYLFAMLEVGLESGGRHLGLLVFDEPRQQETAKESYGALLKHAARIGEDGAQVLFATSEPLSSLRAMLDGCAAHIINLEPGEKLLH